MTACTTRRQGPRAIDSLGSGLTGLLLAALIAGCTACETGSKAGASAPAATAKPGPPDPGARKPTATPAQDVLPQGEPVSFDQYLERVQKVRQLVAKSVVQGLRISERELASHLERSFQRDLPAYALHGTEDLLIALGLVPVEFDYERAMTALLRSQLAGLYDPRLNALFVRDHLEGAELEATLLHELVHALQDQTYGLDDFSSWREDGTDRASALSSLAEGDATSAMYDGLFSLLSERNQVPLKTAVDVSDAELTAGMNAAAEATGDSTIPPVIYRSLLAPYRDGLLFVQELRRRGGWPAVDQAWRKQPESTEQLLHVERYLASEAPVSVSILGPPNGEFTKVLSDVWGEQSLRLAFEEWMPPGEAAEAAAGWAGDRIASFAHENERAITWHLLADDEPSAQRYFDAFRRGVPASATQTACAVRPGLGPLLLSRQGRAVLLLAGPFTRGSPPAAEPGPIKPGATCKDSTAWLKRLSQAR